MTKHIEYKTHGTCSKMIIMDVEDDVIKDCQYIGGCMGNTQGVAALVKGLTVDEAINKLKGIRCGSKQTSCPDQLATALQEAKNQD